MYKLLALIAAVPRSVGRIVICGHGVAWGFSDAGTQPTKQQTLRVLSTRALGSRAAHLPDMKTAEYWLRPAERTRDLKALSRGRTSKAGASGAGSKEEPSHNLVRLTRCSAYSRLRPCQGCLRADGELALILSGFSTARQKDESQRSARAQDGPPSKPYPGRLCTRPARCLPGARVAEASLGLPGWPCPE